MNVLFLNKILKYVLISFIALLSAFSCAKVVEVDIPQHSQKPVAFCFFTKDSTFKMQLSKSVGILDEYSQPITEADILLYENEILMDTLHFNGNFFESDMKAETENEYKFTAQIDDFQEIIATNYVPYAPFLGNCIIYDSNLSLNEDMILNQEVQISMQDNDPDENYYEIILLRKYISPSTNEENIVDTYCYSESPAIVEEGINSPYFKTLVFSDKLFNQTNVTLSIYYDSPNINYGNGNITYFDYSLIVILRSVTQEYYNYKKKLYLHLLNQESDIWNGISVPVQMYTNIENGYGIFAGYNEVRQEVIPGETP